MKGKYFIDIFLSVTALQWVLSPSEFGFRQLFLPSLVRAEETYFEGNDAGKVNPAISTDWWDTRWKYRTRVQRTAPYRDDDTRVIESAVDLPLLLKRAGIPGALDPDSIRVIEPGGRESPSAYRAEIDVGTGGVRHYVTWLTRGQVGGTGVADIYFDTKDAGLNAGGDSFRQLPPENLLRNALFEDGLQSWEVTPEEPVRFERFSHTTGRQSLQLVINGDTQVVDRNITISQTLDIRELAGREMVFECDWLAERAEYGVPISIEIRQFRLDGSQILEFAIEPRWLTLELAEGQLVCLRQRGRFSPEAATASVYIQVRCFVKDSCGRQLLEGPETHFTIWLDRVILRAAERWPWPVLTNVGFVEGAIENAPLNRGFAFTGRRRLYFSGASEGVFSAMTMDAGPYSVHWGLGAGTMEFWCRPAWDPDDSVRRVFYKGYGYLYRLQSLLHKDRIRGRNQLEFVIADGSRSLRRVRGPAPLREGEWSHIAATWDFARAHLQLFVDGKLIGEEGPGEAAWAFSTTARDREADHPGIGIWRTDRRSLPMQGFIGGRMDQKEWPYDGGVEAVIDQFRISDVVRYSEDFVPFRKEFEVDPHTRALWRFENERDGVHYGGDQLVRSYLGVEAPPRKETAVLEVWENGLVESRLLTVKPYPPEELFFANRGSARLDDHQPFRELPDPRFIEYRRRTAEYVVARGDEEFSLEVAGDLDPLMERVVFRQARPSPSTTVLPRWRANDNVVPFSPASLKETLAPRAENDAEKAIEVMKYALSIGAYYDAPYCETLPCGVHRPRVWPSFIRAINIYPFDACGPANYTLQKLFLAAGISGNVFHGTHHQFQQAFYDGDFRLFDASPRMYWLNRDNETVVSLRGIGEDPHCKLREPGSLNSFFPGNVDSAMAAFGTAKRPHSMDFHLRAGERVTVGWVNEGRWFEFFGQRDPLPLAKVPPRFGNGSIEYELTDRGEASEFHNVAIEGETIRNRDDSRPASLIYRVRCPYIFSDAAITGSYAAAGSGSIRFSLSFDRGRTWMEIWENPGSAGRIEVNLRDQVSARYEYWLQVELDPGTATEINNLRVRTTFVNSDLSLPGRLSLGTNRISFVGGEPAIPIRTAISWVERHKTDLGVSLNSLGYYNLDYERHRNLFVLNPGASQPLQVTVEGRVFTGTVSIEGLPDDWLLNPLRQDIVVVDASEPVTAEFTVSAPAAHTGRIEAIEVVIIGDGWERRVPIEVLTAPAALVREAEEADEMVGEVAILDIPDVSGGRAVAFNGLGELAFEVHSPAAGTYALWLRARWEDDVSAKLFLRLKDGSLRQIRAYRLFGFRDWTDPETGYTRGFLHHPKKDEYRHWAWYRVPGIEIPKGGCRLTLLAAAGTHFDALLLLPQTEDTARAGMNLFHNWNYCPRIDRQI